MPVARTVHAVTLFEVRLCFNCGASRKCEFTAACVISNVPNVERARGEESGCVQHLYTRGSAVGVDGARCVGGRAAYVFMLDNIMAVVINVCCVKSFPAQCCCASVLISTFVSLCLRL